MSDNLEIVKRYDISYPQDCDQISLTAEQIHIIKHYFNIKNDKELQKAFHRIAVLSHFYRTDYFEDITSGDILALLFELLKKINKNDAEKFFNLKSSLVTDPSKLFPKFRKHIAKAPKPQTVSNDLVSEIDAMCTSGDYPTQLDAIRLLMSTPSKSKKYGIEGYKVETVNKYVGNTRRETKKAFAAFQGLLI